MAVVAAQRSTGWRAILQHAQRRQPPGAWRGLLLRLLRRQRQRHAGAKSEACRGGSRQGRRPGQGRLLLQGAPGGRRVRQGEDVGARLGWVMVAVLLPAARRPQLRLLLLAGGGQPDTSGSGGGGRTPSKARLLWLLLLPGHHVVAVEQRRQQHRPGRQRPPAGEGCALAPQAARRRLRQWRGQGWVEVRVLC